MHYRISLVVQCKSNKRILISKRFCGNFIGRKEKSQPFMAGISYTLFYRLSAADILLDVLRYAGYKSIYCLDG